jgi:hypothetical protein
MNKRYRKVTKGRRPSDPKAYWRAVKECRANEARSGPVTSRQMTPEERKRYGLPLR